METKCPHCYEELVIISNRKEDGAVEFAITTLARYNKNKQKAEEIAQRKQRLEDVRNMYQNKWILRFIEGLFVLSALITTVSLPLVFHLLFYFFSIDTLNNDKIALPIAGFSLLTGLIIAVFGNNYVSSKYKRRCLERCLEANPDLQQIKRELEEYKKHNA